MTDDDLILAGAGLLLVVLAVRRGYVSPLRRQILAILDEVVPSTYPDARFAALYPGFNPDDPNLPERFSTCGALPTFVGRRLGYRDGITRYGTNSVMTIGRDSGTWVDAGGFERPSPGDFYAIGNASGGVDHVGVIVSASGGTWRTADAGQGTHANQAAAYNDRPYDASAVTIGGPVGPRPLAGWMNVQKYVEEHPV